MPVSAGMVTEQVAQRLAWPHPRAPITVPRCRSFIFWLGLAGAHECEMVLSSPQPTA